MIRPRIFSRLIQTTKRLRSPFLCTPVLILVCVFQAGIAKSDTIDISSSITVTTANESSTLDRRTRMITSTADVTLTNSSSENISSPLHAVIDILDTDYGNVTMPDALGGDGVEPYSKYYYDLSGDLSNGALAPGQSVTFGVKFVRLYTIRFNYNVIIYGNLEAGPVNQAPTADVGGPYFGIVGQSITFDGSGSSDPDGDTLTYAWDFGDGATGSGEQPDHAYAAAGTYTVSLIVSDGQVESDPVSTQVTMSAANIPPVADAGSDQVFTLSSGQTQMDVTLDGSGSSDADGMITGYAWNGTPDPEDVASPVVSLSEGAYTFTLVVTDDDGASSDPASVAITIESAPNTSPTADAGGPYSGITGQSITFDGSGSSDPDGDTLTYAWDFGDGTTGAGVSPVHAYGDAGSYTVSLTVDDGNSGTASSSTTATIYQPPTVGISAEPASIEAGESVVLNWTSTDADSAEIDNNIGSVGTSGSTTVSPSATTTYIITVTGPGGTATASATVTVTSPAPNVTLSADPTTILSGESATLSWTSENAESATMDNGIGEVALNSSISVSPSETTTYLITVTGPGGTATASATVTVTSPAPSVTLSADPTTIMSGESATLTWTSQNAESATIDNGIGNVALSGSTTVSLLETTTYLITVTGPGGTASDSVTVTVSADNEPPVIDAVTELTGQEMETLTCTVSGSDPDDDYPLTFSYNESALPSVSSFEAAADNIYTFSWQPTYDDAGDYTVTFTVNDSEGLASTHNLVIHVTNVNRAPVIDPVNHQYISETNLLEFTVSGTDPDGDDLTYTGGSLPDGAAFDSVTHVFSWTPTYDQASTTPYSVTFTATDPEGMSDTIEVLITVNEENRAPTLDGIADQSVNEGDELTFQLTGSDPDGDEITFSGQGLPSGAVIDEYTGVFSWTPGYYGAGTYQITFTAGDGYDISNEIIVTITVNNINRSPEITTSALPDGKIDQGYNSLVRAQDPDGDVLSYSLAEAPSGMVISSDGRLSSWTPGITDIGEYTVTVEVLDNKGGSDSRTYTISVADTIPPAVTLNAPGQTNPGLSITVEALATDNDGISALELDGNRTDYASPYQASASMQQEITVPSEIGTYTVQARVWDVSGNIGQESAVINIVASFDTTSPQIRLNAPSQVAPGQTILLTASASDDVGVSEITFYTDGVELGSVPGSSPSLEYTVASDAVVGSTLQFTATAVDFSGNSASDDASSVVVETGEEDTSEPETTLTAPEVINEEDPIPVVVETPDEDCLAQIDVYVNHTLAATYYAPDGTSFDVPMPDGIEGGMNVLVEVVVTDCSGNRSATSEWINVKDPSSGVVTGEVYNDSTGLPLAEAHIYLFTEDGEESFTQSDERGRFSLTSQSGPVRLYIEKQGFTPVERTGIQVPADTGIEVYDARLTPVSDETVVVSAVLGETLSDTFSYVTAGLVPVFEDKGVELSSITDGEIMLEITAGALSQDCEIGITQISPQGLAGMLPGGWSPVGAVDIAPYNVQFQNSVTLTIPNMLGLGSDSAVVLAGWDETAHAWIAIAEATFSSDEETIGAAVPLSGQYAFLLPDVLPEDPDDPVVGEPLDGMTMTLLSDQAMAAASPDPSIIFYQPGVYSDVGIHVSEDGVYYPSGTMILNTISEEYLFYSGDTIATDPFIQDIVLYSFARTSLTGAFPVTPSYEFEALSLDKGIITVDALAPADTDRSVNIITEQGGIITTATGESITIPEGAVSAATPVDITPIAQEDLDIDLPSELVYAGGVSISFGGSSLAFPATLSIPSPDGLTEQEQVILVRLAEIQGATRFVLAGICELVSDELISVHDIEGAMFEGVYGAGRYLFLQAPSGVGFATGDVIDTTGYLLPGALVTIEGFPVVALSGVDGGYMACMPIDIFTISALNMDTMDNGDASGTITKAGEVVEIDISLKEEPPVVISTSPLPDAENVPLETSIKVIFSEPLDPLTVSADTVALSGPDGIIEGALSLTTNNTVAVFRPSAALSADTQYTFTVSTGVQDLAGYPLESVYSMGFTSLDTTPPTAPEAGAISATIPEEEGTTTISATQGTAGVHDTVTIINKTQDISTPVLVNEDGSFSAIINADIIDEVVISITDSAGNETVIPIEAFHNADGSTVIGPDGGQLIADNGVILDIPAGAFPDGAIVKLSSVAEEEMEVSPGSDFPFVAGFDLECSEEPQVYMNASAPVSSDVSEDAYGIVARVVEVYGGQPKLSVVDTAKVIEERLTTSSPPCPGLEQRVGRYGMYLNEDQRMYMEQSLISIIATGMSSSTIQVFAENADGDLEVLYEFIAVVGADGQAMGQMYEQTCLPVLSNEPLTVVIRDAETRESIKILEIDPIEPFQHAEFHASLYYGTSDDITPPVILRTVPVNRVLDGYNKRIQIQFSEPIDYMVLLGSGSESVYLTAEDNDDVIYDGTWQLLENNTLLVFETDTQLPLGKQFRLHLENIKDLAGNTYDSAPIIFTTFSPQRIFPTSTNRLNRNRIANDLGIDIQNIPDPLNFSDIDFVTLSPDESYDGKWHTYITAIQDETTASGMYRLFKIDASDPTLLEATGAFQTDPKFIQRKIRLLDNIDIVPREDSWANPQFWKDRLLYYSISDPSIKMCFDPNDPDQEIFDQWFERHCGSDSGGCGVIDGGCGDIAVTIVDNNQYSYLWTYDVTSDDDIKWISSRLLSDNGTGYGYYREYEAPAGMGTPFGLAVLPGMDITHNDMLHQNTVGAYIANYNIGLELADLGLNIPTIDDSERESEDDYPWGYNESLKLNAQLYYLDVAVVPSKTKSDNTIVSPKVVAIATDLSNSTGIKTMEIFRADLMGEPTGLKTLTRDPNYLAVATDIPVYNYDTSEYDEYDLALITTEDGGIFIYEIPEDGSTPQKSRFFVDTPYGVITYHIDVDSGAMLAYVVASNINETTGGDGLLIIDISNPFDYRGDEDDDGWNDRIIGRVPITIPGYAGPVYLNGIRMDKERGLVYAGIEADGDQAIVIIKVRECPDLSVDFNAVPEPDPAPELAEKEALKQVISSAVSESGVTTGSVSMFAYGDRSCLWKEGCEYSDTDKRRYRLAAIVPESEWEKKDLLLVALYEQVIGPTGAPKPIESLGFEVTFDDIEFTAVKWEEFITGNLNIEYNQDDFGLAQQTKLLKWLLNGAYVEGPPELKEDNFPTDIIISLLTDTCEEGECPESEPSHIWRQEGYELGKLQEAALLESGALIRFNGEMEVGTTLNMSLQEDLKEAARAAINSVLARIIANEEGNLFLAFQADTYKGFGLGMLTNDSLDPSSWEPTAYCKSFEHWVASVAARTVQENIGIFTIEEIVNDVYEFQKVADGEKTFDTAEEANAFIAKAYNFIQDVVGGFVWSIYQAKLPDDPNQAQRNLNMTALEARIYELQQAGRKEITPRIVNEGPDDIEDIWVRMYETDAGSGTANATKEVQVNMDAGTEMHPDKDTFVLENINISDASINGWTSFLVDIPERTVREADLDNNWINLFYYVLDPDNPAAPELPQEPDLPVDDPDDTLLDPDPACLCNMPELILTMSISGSDNIELDPGECVNVDVTVVNTGSETLSDVRLYSTFPGLEDWTYDIPEISAGEEMTTIIEYCLPEGETGSIDGFIWFEEMDEEYDPPPSPSNAVHIDVNETDVMTVIDATANGESEIFIGKDTDVTFDVSIAQGACTNPQYLWDLGDAEVMVRGKTGTHAYDEGGTYVAKVSVTCDECQLEDTVDVHVVDMSVEIHGTESETDDLVLEKSDIPERISEEFATIKLNKALSENVQVVLNNPDDRLRFKSDSEDDWATTLPLTFTPNTTSKNIYIAGFNGSESIDDAHIEIEIEDEPGVLVGSEEMTVFWFDSSDDDSYMKVIKTGSYTLTMEEYTVGEGLAAVGLYANARIMPFGLDCTAPQISKLQIGMVQNMEDANYSTTLKYVSAHASDGVEPFTGLVPDIMEINTIIKDKMLDASEGEVLYAFGGQPKVDIQCIADIEAFSAWSSDTPSSLDLDFIERLYFYDNDGNIIGYALYALTSCSIDANFRIWTVIFDKDTEEIIKTVSETTWALNVDSNGEDPQEASPNGSYWEPNTSPVLTSPVANFCLNYPDDDSCKDKAEKNIQEFNPGYAIFE